MPLHLQASYHPDYGDALSGTTLNVKDDVFKDKSTAYYFAMAFFRRNYVKGVFPTTYGIPSSIVYIPFNYKPAVTSINAASISAQTLGTVITSGPYGQALFYQKITNYLDDYKFFQTYFIGASQITVIIINKFYCNFRDVVYWQSDIESNTIIQDDSIYINYSFAKLISIDVKTNNFFDQDAFTESNVNFILRSEKTYDYLEDFSDKIYYSAGAYYKDEGFTELLNLKIRNEFFPFLLVNNDSQGIRGKVTSDLKNLDDLDLISLGEDLDGDGYVDITPVNPPILNQNIITCSVNSPGYADVVYGGKPYSFEDAQICGTPSVINGNPIAVIRRDNQSNLDLFTDFTALNSETVTIYANNFQYIKYVTLVNNSIVYTTFLNNGSPATSTVKFSSQVLDLSKYYSIEEDEGGYISGITFRFVVYETLETEAKALTYDLTIPVTILIPKIESASYSADDNSQLELVSNYAKKIEYYLKEESTKLEVEIDQNTPADGLAQKTIIDIDYTSKSITAIAYGFFHDFDGGPRAPYKSENFNQEIDFNVEITSFALQLKNGTLFTSRTFYDSSDAVITNLVKAPCLIGSFDNYRTYLNYTDVYDVIFVFVFTLATGFKSLFFEIGEGTDRYQLTTLINIPISRNELFKRADINGKINLTVWLDNKIPFKIPFQFLNFSTTPPNVTYVSAPTITGASKIRAFFNFEYEYADSVTYSILDQDDSVVYGPVTLPKKSYTQLYDLFSSGSTVSENIKTDEFEIQPSVTSLKVEVTASSLTSAFVLQSDSLQSSTTSLPQQLNSQTPAQVKFYYDELMSVENTTYISRGVTYYAFLQLKDVNGADILPANYGSYISLNPSPKFEAIESQDANIDIDLNGVSVTKINDYLYSFKISPSSPFNDSAFVLDITYSPIIGIPTRDDRIGRVP